MEITVQMTISYSTDCMMLAQVAGIEMNFKSR